MDTVRQDVNYSSIDSSEGLRWRNVDLNFLPSPSSSSPPMKFYHSNRFKIVATFLLISLSILISGTCIAYYGKMANNSSVTSGSFNLNNLPNEQLIWFEKGEAELLKALNRKENSRKARNVILFVGDGMGPNTVTAARIYGFGEDGLMAWEEFPNMGLLKTYCADKLVPDSASTATALFSGVKTNYETSGIDASVHFADCPNSLNSLHQLPTIMSWAQDEGLHTGFVTTTRVTHATPSALYAHVPDRSWECENNIPEYARVQGCTDIATQLVEGNVGQKINVIMGGGRQMLISNISGSKEDPLDTWAGYSKDGRHLIQKWMRKKQEQNRLYQVVQNRDELMAIDGTSVNYVLGIFANGHLKYDNELDMGSGSMPSLKEMTVKALQILSSRERGFLLVVEGGLIDQAHHRGKAKKAINEVLAFNNAINASIQALSEEELENTLIIVTADHSHTLTINGYPKRGTSVFGIAGNSKTEGTPYTVLTYGTTGKGFQTDDKCLRKDPATDDTENWEYTQQGAVNTDENSHGGSDVTIHATGAMSHLFHGVHEQSYVAHAISYALRIGRFRESALVNQLNEKTTP
ncbi:alkaline phosphatase isoform X1 [Glossina fuscipes]|uniref:Alkaline phosphatase n=2 Tax=Glossina fuscipes TaxID=7396 RepID=A0A8U0WI55_9MUSC|nr:alkaline phosphatase isoform X1 [Glossina fuscipes]